MHGLWFYFSTRNWHPGGSSQPATWRVSLTEESNPKATLIVADSVNSMVKAVHRNVDQEFLFVTIDKVRISLMVVYSDIEHSKSWHAPLGILATLSVIFPNTSFQQWLTVKPEVWQAFFYFVAERLPDLRLNGKPLLKRC